MSSAHYDEPERGEMNDNPSADNASEMTNGLSETDESREDQIKVLVEHLREAREAKGWSPEDLSDKTRISLHVVHSIEQGDLDVVEVPSMRAFLRTYARVVGVPTEEIEDLYPEPKALVEEPPEGEDVHAIPIPSRTRLPWRAIGKGAAIAGILLIIYWVQPWYSVTGDSDPTPLHTEAPIETPPVTEPVDTVSVELVENDADLLSLANRMPEPGEEPVLRQREPLATVSPPQIPGRTRETALQARKTSRLVASAIDSVWVQLKDAATEDIIYDAILQPGLTRAWSVSDTVLISLGRHWAVSMTLDGDTIQIPGRAGRNFSAFYLGPHGIVQP